MAKPRDVSRNVGVPSLGTVCRETVGALEEAILVGDTARALKLVGIIREVATARRRTKKHQPETVGLSGRSTKGIAPSVSHEPGAPALDRGS